MRTTKQNSIKNNSVPFGLPDDSSFYENKKEPASEKVQIGWASVKELRRISAGLEKICLFLEYFKVNGCLALPPAVEETLEKEIKEEQEQKPKCRRGRKKKEE